MTFFLLLVWLTGGLGDSSTADDRHGIVFVVQILALFTFIAGLLFGMRGIAADSWLVFRFPLALTYGVVAFLCLLGRADFREFAAFVGLITPGIISSCLASVLLAEWIDKRSKIQV